MIVSGLINGPESLFLVSDQLIVAGDQIWWLRRIRLQFKVKFVFFPTCQDFFSRITCWWSMNKIPATSLNMDAIRFPDIYRRSSAQLSSCDSIPVVVKDPLSLQLFQSDATTLFYSNNTTPNYTYRLFAISDQVYQTL